MGERQKFSLTTLSHVSPSKSTQDLSSSLLLHLSSPIRPRSQPVSSARWPTQQCPCPAMESLSHPRAPLDLWVLRVQHILPLWSGNKLGLLQSFQVPKFADTLIHAHAGKKKDHWTEKCFSRKCLLTGKHFLKWGSLKWLSKTYWNYINVKSK